MRRQQRTWYKEEAAAVERERERERASFPKDYAKVNYG
jgi:hypothetical protein